MSFDKLSVAASRSEGYYIKTYQSIHRFSHMAPATHFVFLWTGADMRD